jgi:hypothetical protein
LPNVRGAGVPRTIPCNPAPASARGARRVASGSRGPA